MNIRTCVPIALAAILLSGCVKDKFQNIVIQPNLTLPLGNVTVSDSSLFATASVGDMMSVGQDGVLNVGMIDTVTVVSGKNMSTIFSFKDQYRPFSQDLPVGQGIERLAFRVNINLAAADERVDVMTFKDGKLSVKLSGVSHTGTLKITIPQIKRNGNPLIVKPDEVVTLGKSDVMTLGNTNAINIVVEGNMVSEGRIEGVFNLHGVKISDMTGFAGRKKVPTINTKFTATDDFTEFANQADYIYFANPSLIFNIENQYSVPAKVDLKSFEIDGVAIDMNIDAGLSNILLQGKSKRQIEITNKSTVSGDQLSQLLTKDFTYISFDVDALTNPSAQDLNDPSYIPTRVNTIAAQDSLFCGYTLQIPMYGVFDNLTFNDEMELDLADLIKDNVTYTGMDFAIIGTNEMPLGLSIDAIIPDSGWGTTITPIPILMPSSVNNLPANDPAFVPGEVTEDNVQIHSLSGSMIAKLLKSKKLILRLRASSLDVEAKRNVKIFSPSELNLRVVMNCKAEITLNEK